MAVGGGNWQVQNKILPGAYINFTSGHAETAISADGGVVPRPEFTPPSVDASGILVFAIVPTVTTSGALDMGLAPSVDVNGVLIFDRGD